MQFKYLQGFRSFWPIDKVKFAKIEPWSPYIFMDPPACPACHKYQGGILIEQNIADGTLWTCWRGCGQRYYTSY